MLGTCQCPTQGTHTPPSIKPRVFLEDNMGILWVFSMRGQGKKFRKSFSSSMDFFIDVFLQEFFEMGRYAFNRSPLSTWLLKNLAVFRFFPLPFHIIISNLSTTPLPAQALDCDIKVISSVAVEDEKSEQVWGAFFDDPLH